MYIVLAVVLSVVVSTIFDLNPVQAFLVGIVIGGIGGWVQANVAS